MKKKLEVWLESVKTVLLDEPRRIHTQYIVAFSLLGLVSLFMTVVNVFTHKGALTWATAIFAVLCAVDVLLLFSGEKCKKLATTLFLVEMVVLFVFFIVSGNPEGFSAIWIAMLPACGMLLFQRKQASILCAIMMLVMVFFFWCPYGQTLLQYEYTESFKMRFPMLYTAFYLISLFLETVRELTQKELYRLQDQYHNLYLHDELTGTFNRHGFEDVMRQEFNRYVTGNAAMLLLDIDLFKVVNDTYGHLMGDEVLKAIAKIMAEVTGRQVCRWGGEEFIVFYPLATIYPRDAELLRTTVENTPILVGNNEIHVTVSIGVSVVSRSEKKAFETMLSNADYCLYEAKNSGRNRVVYKDSTHPTV